MPVHTERKIVSYTAEQMFDLVADIERYPEFLPWCLAARTIRRDGSMTLYELVAGFRMVREKFTSKVIFDRPHTIETSYVRGPMRHMRNSWRFTDLAEGGCEIEMDVDFEFRSRLMQKLIGALFHEAVMRMVASFEARAKVVYGGSGADKVEGPALAKPA